MESLPPQHPVTLCLGEGDDQPVVWIDCTHRETTNRVVALSPRAELGPRLHQRLAQAEAGYLAFEDRDAPLAWKGIARASESGIDFLMLDGSETGSALSVARRAPASEPLLRLMYVSQAAPDLDETGLNSILVAANRRNLLVAITGALCFRHGFFGQILEGPEPAVRETYELIVSDPRHTDPVVLLEERAAHRLYGAWSMRGIHGQSDFTAADELAARLALAERRDSPELTRRWLQLLELDSGPAWRDAWLSGKQSVLIMRELVEQSAAQPDRGRLGG